MGFFQIQMILLSGEISHSQTFFPKNFHSLTTTLFLSIYQALAILVVRCDEENAHMTRILHTIHFVFVIDLIEYEPHCLVRLIS
jgi:hypothetical protein